MYQCVSCLRLLLKISLHVKEKQVDYLFKGYVGIASTLFELVSEPLEESFTWIPSKPLQQVWQKATIATSMIYKNQSFQQLKVSNLCFSINTHLVYKRVHAKSGIFYFKRKLN